MVIILIIILDKRAVELIAHGLFRNPYTTDSLRFIALVVVPVKDAEPPSVVLFSLFSYLAPTPPPVSIDTFGVLVGDKRPLDNLLIPITGPRGPSLVSPISYPLPNKEVGSEPGLVGGTFVHIDVAVHIIYSYLDHCHK
jgi:hypothetical protein